MTEERNTWLVALSLSMLLLVVGLLFLDHAAWFVQYPVLLAAVVLSVVGMLQALDDESSA